MGIESMPQDSLNDLLEATDYLSDLNTCRICKNQGFPSSKAMPISQTYYFLDFTFKKKKRLKAQTSTLQCF